MFCSTCFDDCNHLVNLFIVYFILCQGHFQDSATKKHVKVSANQLKVHQGLWLKHVAMQWMDCVIYLKRITKTNA